MLIPTWRLQTVGAALVAIVVYGINYLLAFFNTDPVAREVIIITALTCGSVVAAGLIAYTLWVENKPARKAG
jgi:hypothetical protein